MVGMWLNCIFGGKGVGMINMLLYVIVGIFVAGMMVGRTPEYLGKKIGAREIKLAVIALLIHPLMILFPSGLFAATDWGLKATSNPGAHGLSQIMYQFSSASANNGSAFDGLGVSYGFYNNPNPAPEAVAWDIATGIVIIISRFIPIIAPIAMAAYLGMKKTSPFGLGTLRDNTLTFRNASFCDNHYYRRPAFLTYCRAWTVRRAFRPDAVWGINKKPIDVRARLLKEDFQSLTMEKNFRLEQVADQERRD